LRNIRQNSKGVSIAVGGNGTIIRKESENAEWVLVNAGFANFWRSVSFRTDTEVWIVGEAQSIAVSQDSGKTWKKLNNPSLSGNFGGVLFTDAQNGIIVADVMFEVQSSYNTIMRTTDGGYTWFEQMKVSNGTWNFLERAYDNSIIAGLRIDNSNGLLYRSFDDGKSWTKIDYIPFANPVFVDFKNAQEGIGIFAAPGGNLRKTTDGGITWSDIPSAPSISFAGLRFVSSGRILLSGIASTSPQHPVIYRSDDFGQSWNLITTVSSYLSSIPVYFYNKDQKVYLLGTAGFLAESTNNGDDFKLKSSFYRQVSGIYIKGLSNGQILFNTFQQAPNTPFFKTIDKFDTTTLMNFTSASNVNMNVMCSTSDGMKIFIGGANMNAYYSYDGGQSFTLITVGNITGGIIPGSSSITACSWLDQNSIVIGAANAYTARSVDSGVNWSAHTSVNTSLPAIRNFAVSPSNSNIVIGVTGIGSANVTTAAIIKSSDAGINWTSTSYQNINFTDVSCIDSVTCYAFGFYVANTTFQTNVFKTTDAGNSWTKIVPLGLIGASPRKCHFFNTLEGWLSTNRGLYYTKDGGLTWSESILPYINIGYNDITSLSDGTVYAIGQNMSIISAPNRGFQ